MKLLERVIELRPKKEMQVADNQFDFMLARSTMEAIYLPQHVMERYKMDKQDLHLVFIDLEKAYESASRYFVESPREEKRYDCLYLSY